MTKERLKDRKRNQEKSKSVQNYFHQKEDEVHVDSKEGKKQKSVTLPLRKRALPSDEENFLDDHDQSDSTTKRKKSKKGRGANTSEPSVSNDDKRQRKSEEKKKRTIEVEFTGTANASVCEESDCKEKPGFDSDSKKKELRDFNREHSKRKNDKESKVEVSEKRKKKKHDDERTLHEVQQGISLKQKGDVQNICDSKNVDHEVKDKKKKKKKKNEIELENTLDTSNDKTSGLCTKVESEKSDTVKEKKKKKSKRQPGEASKAVVHPGVGYLRTWYFDRRNWNFKKVRQVWLLQNMFDQEQVSEVILCLLSIFSNT